MTKWTADQWKSWQENNMKLLLDGWTLESSFMVDGSVHECATNCSEVCYDNAVDDANSLGANNVSISQKVQD